MPEPKSAAPAPLRIFCLEDNPLIVFHLEQMIEDLGHVFAGSSESFAGLRDQFSPGGMDVALVDIDLADGATGPAAAKWLAARGVPSLFVTGQDEMAVQHAAVSIGALSKPVTPIALAEALVGVGRYPARS